MPDDRVADKVPPGSVVVLRDAGASPAQVISQYSQDEWRGARRRLVAIVAYIVVAGFVALPWIEGLRGGGAVGLAAWAMAIWALIGATALVAVLMLDVTGRWTWRSDGGVAVGWLCGGGALFALAAGRVLADGLGLTSGAGLVTGVWLGCAFGTVLWAWVRGPIVKLAAQWLCVAALVVTALVVVPVGWVMLEPLILAGLAALLVVVPTMAPRVPDDQLVDMTLLATAALATRSVEARPQGRISGARTRSVVRDGETVWSVAAVIVGVATMLAAWPVLPVVWVGGLSGWSMFVVVAAGVVILALAPVTSSLVVVRLAPRFAAVGVLVVWIVKLALFGGEVSSGVAWWLAVGLVGLGVVSMVVSFASTRDEGAPMLGRIGDMALWLAQVVLLPAAFLASGLFQWLWTAPL